MGKKRGCADLEPDCFNCSFEDCKASNKDIVKQIKYKEKQRIDERNKIIYDLFVKGCKAKDIAEGLSISKDTVYKAIKKEGEHVREKCRYAEWDYCTYYGITRKQFFCLRLHKRL